MRLCIKLYGKGFTEVESQRILVINQFYNIGVYTMKKSLVIDAETIIVNLLREDKKYYVDIDRIDQLCSYIKEQLIQGNYFDEYQTVVFDVNFDAIARTVQYRSNIFDLVGDRIYLKCEQDQLPDIPQTNGRLLKMISDFVERVA